MNSPGWEIAAKLLRARLTASGGEFDSSFRRFVVSWIDSAWGRVDKRSVSTFQPFVRRVHTLGRPNDQLTNR
jgi:hypothetical protein